MADKKAKHRKNKNKKDNSRKNSGSATHEGPKNAKNNKIYNHMNSQPVQVTFSRMTRSKGAAENEVTEKTNAERSSGGQSDLSPQQQESGTGKAKPMQKERENIPISSPTSKASAQFPGSTQPQVLQTGTAQAGPTISQNEQEPYEKEDTRSQGKHTVTEVIKDNNGLKNQHNVEDDLSPTEHSQGEAQSILQSLATINFKLQKLDTLDSITVVLKEGLLSVQNKVDGMLNQMGSVKEDLRRCEEKWEAGANALSERITKLERSAQGMNNKWDSFRAKVQKDVAIKQSSIDSNSSSILDLEAKVALLQEKQSNIDNNSTKIKELEAQVRQYREKWETLEATEKKIEKAAEDKFKLVQDTLKQEIQKEIMRDIPKAPPPAQQEPLQANRYDRLKDQAHKNRHNIVLFG